MDYDVSEFDGILESENEDDKLRDSFFVAALYLLKRKSAQKGGGNDSELSRIAYGYPYNLFQNESSNNIFELTEENSIQFLKTKESVYQQNTYKINFLEMVRSQYKLDFDEKLEPAHLIKNLIKNKQIFKELQNNSYDFKFNTSAMRNSNVIKKSFNRVLLKTNNGWLDDNTVVYFTSKLKGKRENVEIFNSHTYNIIENKYGQYADFDTPFNDKRIIYIPINPGDHWLLAKVDFSQKTITFYDSLNSSNRVNEYNVILDHIFILLEYDLNILEEKSISEEKFGYTDKKKRKINVEKLKNKDKEIKDLRLFYNGLKKNEWKMIKGDSPKQNNDYDCGVYAITNLILLVHGIEPTQTAYDSNDIKMIRAYIFDEMSQHVKKKKKEPSQHVDNEVQYVSTTKN